MTAEKSVQHKSECLVPQQTLKWRIYWGCASLLYTVFEKPRRFGMQAQGSLFSSFSYKSQLPNNFLKPMSKLGVVHPLQRKRLLPLATHFRNTCPAPLQGLPESSIRQVMSPNQRTLDNVQPAARWARKVAVAGTAPTQIQSHIWLLAKVPSCVPATVSDGLSNYYLLEYLGATNFSL